MTLEVTTLSRAAGARRVVRLTWPAWRPSTSTWLALAIGFALALLFSTLNIIRAATLSPPAHVQDIVIEAFARWMVYAAFAPLVAALVTRWPLSREHRGRRVLGHVAAMSAIALLHNVTIATIYGVFHIYPPGSTYAEAIRRLFMVYFGLNFVTFWALDGAYHALRYHREMRAREQLAAELRAQLSTAQLDNLRAQLNPHFLFNTLNAVSSLALSGQRESVVRTLSMLSDLLRISLDRDLPQEIPLARELEILRSYLEIQHTRFGERVVFRLEIEPAALAARLPSMILQPLVENAIQHGVSARPGPGSVVVRARREGGRLALQVEDTGPGFTPEASAQGDHGIGLANTRARLARLYGGSQSLECGNLPNGGATVEVTLPWHLDDDAPEPA